MSRLDKLVLTSLTAILLFIVSTVRVHEHLSCTADATGLGLSCERVQTRLIVSSDQHLRIPDAGSVVLRLSSYTTSSHNTVSSSVIEARDENGRRVVLLSVPERNGPIPLTTAFSGFRSGPETVGGQIQQFLRDAGAGSEIPLRTP